MFKNNRIRKHVTKFKTPFPHPLSWGRHKYMISKSVFIKLRKSVWKNKAHTWSQNWTMHVIRNMFEGTNNQLTMLFTTEIFSKLNIGRKQNFRKFSSQLPFRAALSGGEINDDRRTDDNWNNWYVMYQLKLSISLLVPIRLIWETFKDNV